MMTAGSMLALAEDSNRIEVTETTIVGLLVVASLVAIAARRIRLPYTVALVLVGLALGASNAFSSVHLTENLILLAFLPPLLFEGAINLDFDQLWIRKAQVLLLVVPGTLVASLVLTLALMAVPGLAARYAFVIAVILAPTDPVSVLAIFKSAGVSAGLQVLIEAESLFNDALGIVLFLLAVEGAFPVSGQETTLVGGAADFIREIGVGVAAGVAVGLVAHRLMATLDDHLVEITLSLVTAYGAYLAATRLSGSGVIATVVSGLLIGNYGMHRSMSETSRVTMVEFWEVIAFVANSALFLLIGLEFRFADLFEGRTATATVVAIAAMLIGRVGVVYLGVRPLARPIGPPIPKEWFPVIVWGGLRGSIPIALALGLAQPTIGGVNVPAMTFAVVVFSLIVQGITVRPLLRRLGLSAVEPGG
jgi:CPA1 family monovalent cation:H+ antiporter